LHAFCFSIPGLILFFPHKVRNAEAEELGVSLFRRLSEAHPGAMVNLEHQYRMNYDIMSVSNFLVYNNRLRAGTEEVAKSMLHVPRPDRLRELHVESGCQGESTKPSVCWLEHLICPK
jgi:DNA replication ATP-dependent helicase Dna2